MRLVSASAPRTKKGRIKEKCTMNPIPRKKHFTICRLQKRGKQRESGEDACLPEKTRRSRDTRSVPQKGFLNEFHKINVHMKPAEVHTVWR